MVWKFFNFTHRVHVLGLKKTLTLLEGKFDWEYRTEKSYSFEDFNRIFYYVA